MALVSDHYDHHRPTQHKSRPSETFWTCFCKSPLLMCGATLSYVLSCCPRISIPLSAVHGPRCPGHCSPCLRWSERGAWRQLRRAGRGARSRGGGERREEGSRLYAAGHYTVLAIMIPGSLHRGALILLGAAAGNNKQPPTLRINWLLVTFASIRRSRNVPPSWWILEEVLMTETDRNLKKCSGSCQNFHIFPHLELWNNFY